MEGERQKYIKIWTIHSILYSFSTTISVTYYQAYAVKVLGFDVGALGNVTFLNLGAISIGNALGALIVYRLRSRRVLLWKIFTTLNLLFWALTGFSDSLNPYAIYLFIFLAQFGGAIGGLAYSDTISDLIPKSISVSVFSKVNTYTLSAAVLSLAISTAFSLNPRIGIIRLYRVLYGLALASAVLSASVLWLMKDIVKRENTMISFREFYGDVQRLLSEPPIRSYITFLSMFTFFVNIPGALWNYYIIKVFGGDETWISLNTISSTLANAIGNYIFGKLAGRVPRKKIIVFSIALISMVPIIFLFSNTMLRQIAMNAYSGFSWSAFNLLTGIYNLYLAGEKRIYMISLIGVTTNVLAAVATRIGAFVASINLLSMQLTFVVSAIGRLIMLFYARKRLVEL
jgi:predicted MFS family arabinose efflux permease